MESDSPDEAGESELMIFISDASAEAERLTLALRTLRYVVIDVPLSLLAHRVRVQRPALVLCDADADGALDVLKKLAEGAEEEEEGPLPVVLLGRRGGTMESIDGALVAAVFARPVNIRELSDTVERLAGSPGAGPRSPAPPSRRLGTSSHPPSTKGGRPDAAAVPLPPDLAGDAAPRENGDAPALELSPEIMATLADAERRWEASRPEAVPATEEPGPEVDIEAPLPGDVLAALDEPLDDEEAEEQAHETASGGTAHGGRTGRGQTFAGTTGTTGAGTTGLDRRDSRLPPRPAAPSDRPREPEPPAEEGRAARQQASTPKPPRHSDDTRATGVGEAERRPSAPPATVADPALFAVSRLGGPPSLAEAPSRSLAVPTSRMDGPEPRVAQALTSTTPPYRSAEARDQAAPAVIPARAAADAEERPAARDEPRAAGPEVPGGSALEVPPVLRGGDAILAVARAIRARFTGALRFEVDEGIRRIVFRDGDFVTAASAVHSESLVAFLGGRGDLPPEVVKQAHKLPAFGRRAGAALIAQGHLPQESLWTVLRAHAEWLIGRVLRIERGTAAVETSLIDRLRDEPAVFGGATGAEVFVEGVRRVVPEEEAMSRLGGAASTLEAGTSRALLDECALPAFEGERVQSGSGRTVSEIVQGAPDPSFAAALSGLVALGVLSVHAPGPRAAEKAPEGADPIEEDARRERILTRKALVDDGDYFAVLGVSHDATSYDIKRAYSVLRRDFEPSRALTMGTADLAEVVDEIIEVLEEAYEVLGDQRRRERYRKAILAVP